MTTYDLIVIGGGSGGSACARRASGYGAKVALIEKGPTRDSAGNRTGAGFGGTCVNVGCVPKKVMWLAANQREALHGVSPHMGLAVPDGAGAVDWPKLVEKRNAYVAGLNKSYETNWTKAGIQVIVGEATFKGAGDGKTQTVLVTSADGATQTLTGHKVLVAVGGMPASLKVPGADLAINSDAFFDIPQRPRRVAVVGAGYIAVELAGILHALGSETHLFFRGPTVLQHGFDSYIVETLMGELEAHGPALHPRSTPTRLSRAGDGSITLTTSSAAGSEEKEHTGFDCVLVAVGRTPSTARLGLEAVGVKTTATGHIKVDPFEATSNPSILAIGDATTTGHELTPVAIAAGRRLADRLFGNEPRARLEYDKVPTVVFSHPPIGCVGLTEVQARARYGDASIRVKMARFSSMVYALCPPEAKVKTALKLVLCGPEERIVGLHCIGPYSDEMLQGFAVAVRMGATRRDFEATVAIHPSIAEELVTFGGWGQKAEDPRRGETKVLLPPYLDPSKDAPRVWPMLLGVSAATAAVTVAICVAVMRS